MIVRNQSRIISTWPLKLVHYAPYPWHHPYPWYNSLQKFSVPNRSTSKHFKFWGGGNDLANISEQEQQQELELFSFSFQITCVSNELWYWKQSLTFVTSLLTTILGSSNKLIRSCSQHSMNLSKKICSLYLDGWLPSGIHGSGVKVQRLQATP